MNTKLYQIMCWKLETKSGRMTTSYKHFVHKLKLMIVVLIIVSAYIAKHFMKTMSLNKYKNL